MKRYYYLKQTVDAVPKRTYPTGEAIPESLPASYGIAWKCGNCAAFDSVTTMCSTYNAPVLPDYWCDTWKAQ